MQQADQSLQPCGFRSAVAAFAAAAAAAAWERRRPAACVALAKVFDTFPQHSQ